MTANALADETSPYLLQHKDNPVNWYAWSPEAFQRARDEDKPILLSIGYAACHWCHVMAHESFEDATTAALMNANFINIKVDREERPDVDRFYMAALHALGQPGGWPLTMFLAPDGHPFWGGTYFPPESRYGRPGFRHVLGELARIWRDERHKADSNVAALLEALSRPPAAPGDPPGNAEIAEAAAALCRTVDPVHGGLKGAPKFPQAPLFDFLLHASLAFGMPAFDTAARTTALRMSQGGIYDHLAGGLARYSVDPVWLVPHFEKMLYDNAQYVSLLTRLHLAKPSHLFRTRIAETIAFLDTDFRTSDGLYAASFDADSEGHEGRYYVWTQEEVDAILGAAPASRFSSVYNVTPEGNWEGRTILHRSQIEGFLDPAIEEALAKSRAILLDRRRRRIAPARDDKVLVDWNALAIAALADAALVFGDNTWRRRAEAMFERLRSVHWRDDRLLHSSTGGLARHEATADGYAFLTAATLALHRLTGNAGYVTEALRFTDAMVGRHWDDDRNGFCFSSSQVTELPLRDSTIHDDATPNANAIMMFNLHALHRLVGREDDRRRAERIARQFATPARDNPFAAPSYFKARLAIDVDTQIVIAGDVADALIADALKATGLDVVIRRVSSPGELSPAHPAYGSLDVQRPALLICRSQACSIPVRNPEDLAAALRILGPAT